MPSIRTRQPALTIDTSMLYRKSTFFINILKKVFLIPGHRNPKASNGHDAAVLLVLDAIIFAQDFDLISSVN
jgi:hypothetical protein